MIGNDGKLDRQLVIEKRTWDRQFAQYTAQPDGPLKGAAGYVCDMLAYTRLANF